MTPNESTAQKPNTTTVVKVKDINHYREILKGLSPELTFTEDRPDLLKARCSVEKTGYVNPLRIEVTLKNTEAGLMIDFQDIFHLHENKTNIDFYLESFLKQHTSFYKPTLKKR